MNKKIRYITSLILSLSMIFTLFFNLSTNSIIYGNVDNIIPVIVFQNSDGSIVRPNDSGEFNLNTLSDGKFIIENLSDYNNSIEPYWNSSVIRKENGLNFTDVWVYADGTYQGYESRTVDVNLYSRDRIYNDSRLLKTFKVHNEASSIVDLKVLVDNKEVSIDSPAKLSGKETKKVTVYGKRADGDFFPLKPNMLRFLPLSDNDYFTIDGSFSLSPKSNGQGDFLVKMVDNSASLTFRAIEEKIVLENFNIAYPLNFEISDYDGLGNNFIGVTPNVYSVTYTPDNASNKSLTWEALTPDIAIFEEKFGKGIVPLKAGLASFNVTSQGNPNLKQRVDINFTYKEPLKAMVLPISTYFIKEGESINLNMNPTPENATMQLYDWSYSKPDIASVNSTISRNDLNKPHSFTHMLRGLSPGVVRIIGTPKDRNLKENLVIDVTVLPDEAGPKDYIKLAKDNIKFSLNNLSKKNSLNFNNEWNLITLATMGLPYGKEEIQEYINNSFNSINENLNIPTTLERVILAIAANGGNPMDVNGMNLIEELVNHDGIEEGGSNNSIFALLALDSKNFEVSNESKWTRDALIDKILSFQNEDGSFGLFNDGKGSTDITAMALQALAPYKDREDVKPSIEKALNYLSLKQDLDGGFGNNSPSSAQVLIALSSLGIDGSKDERFVKGNNNILDFLDSTRTDGGYSISADTDSNNSFANYQVAQAFTSFIRFIEKNKRYFDFSDISKNQESDDNGDDSYNDEVDFSTIDDFIMKLEANQGLRIPEDKEKIQALRTEYNQLHKKAPEEYLEDLENGLYLLKKLEVALAVNEYKFHLELDGNDNAETLMNQLKKDMDDIVNNEELTSKELAENIEKLEKAYKEKLDKIKYETDQANEFDFSSIMDLIDEAEALINSSLPVDEGKILDLRGKYEALREKVPEEYEEDLNNVLIPLRVAEVKLDIFKYSQKSDKEKSQLDKVIENFSKELNEILDTDISTEEALLKIDEAVTKYKEEIDNIHVERDTDISEDPAKDIVGNIFLSVEKFTIGQGSLIEPVKIPLLKGDKLSDILVRFFKDRGLDIRTTGTVGDSFYLSKIDDQKGSLTGLFPTHIIDELKNRDITPKTERKSSLLGEFDYTNRSGWVFSLNNIHSSVGMSETTLKNDDVVRLAFTVIGGGKDVWTTADGSYLNESPDKSELIKTIANFNSQENKDELLMNYKVLESYNNLIKSLENFNISADQISSNIESFKDALNKKDVVDDKEQVEDTNNQDDKVENPNDKEAENPNSKKDEVDKENIQKNNVQEVIEHQDDKVENIHMAENNKKDSKVKTNKNRVMTGDEAYYLSEELLYLYLSLSLLSVILNKKRKI